MLLGGAVNLQFVRQVRGDHGCIALVIYDSIDVMAFLSTLLMEYVVYVENIQAHINKGQVECMLRVCLYIIQIVLLQNVLYMNLKFVLQGIIQVPST